MTEEQKKQTLWFQGEIARRLALQLENIGPGLDGRLENEVPRVIAVPGDGAGPIGWEVLCDLANRHGAMHGYLARPWLGAHQDDIKAAVGDGNLLLPATTMWAFGKKYFLVYHRCPGAESWEFAVRLADDNCVLPGDRFLTLNGHAG